VIRIPFKIQLKFELSEIQGYCVVWFQDNTLQNPGPHWHILIRIKNTDDFLVTIITSQLEKRLNYYKNTKQRKAVRCLVKVGNNEFSFLHKEKNSAVNCNETKLLSIIELVHLIDEDQGFNVEKEKVPTYLKKEIVSAINQSPLHSKKIKNLAKETNPV